MATKSSIIVINKKIQNLKIHLVKLNITIRYQKKIKILKELKINTLSLQQFQILNLPKINISQLKKKQRIISTI
jgi:hypothetical protein